MSLLTTIQLHASGNLAAAEQGYRSHITDHPASETALGNLAIICLMDGRTDEALQLLKAALAANPNNPEFHLNYGIGLNSKGNREEAIACFHRALELNPVYPQAYNNLGVAHVERGCLEEAVECYQLALELQPSFPEAHYNLGNVYCAQGLYEDAISSYQKAIEYRPDYPQAFLTLAAAYANCGQFDVARNCLQRALELKPNYPEACLNLGSLLSGQSRYAEAIPILQRAVDLNPNFAEAYNNLGLALKELTAFEDATASYQKAIALRPDMSMLYSNLGLCLLSQSRVDEAIAAYQRTLELQTPGSAPASPVRRLGNLLIQIESVPIVYESSAELEQYRERVVSCLKEAGALAASEADKLTGEEMAVLRSMLFRMHNFQLAYQQKNDREIQIAYSKLASELLGKDFKPYATSGMATRRDGKIRIGIASKLLCDHNASSWAFSWFDQLPRQDYEFFSYSLQGPMDKLTSRFAELGTHRWLPFSESTYLNSLEAIRRDQLDVLIVPDVGLTPESRIISLARLAPIQCAAWGHTVTTGSPNMDFYLSGDLMEPHNGEEHYSEELVRLSNIGLDVDWPEAPPAAVSRSEFDLPEDSFCYGVAQSIFKFLPQFDYIFPAIAKQVPKALFVFACHESAHVTEVFRQRLRGSFEAAGLDFDTHVKILSRMSRSKYMQLLSVLDVSLDPIGFNGGTTAIRALSMNCPIVTAPGAFMRARTGYAMLKMIRVEDLIAGSLDEYIAIAVRIGQDRSFCSNIAAKIDASKHLLFNDKQCIASLDRFLKSQVFALRAAAGAEHPGEAPPDAAISAEAACEHYGNLAYESLVSGRFDDCLAYCNMALEIDSGNSDIHLKIGCAHRARGDNASAVAAWSKALEFKPDYPEAYLNLGVANLEQGKLDEAETCYEKALEYRPDYPEALHNLGSIYKAKGKSEEAIACYRRAIELRPDYVEAHLNLGTMFGQHLDEAISCYRRALEINPNYTEAHINLGGALRVLGRLDEAVSHYNRALEINPNRVEALNNLGVALREQGKFAESAAACRKVLEINPSYPDALLNLGLVLKDLGELEEAITCHRKVLELVPDRADAYRNLADSYYALGDLEKGLSFDHKAVEVRVAALPRYSECKRLCQLLVELKRIPTVYREAKEVELCRKHYSTCLYEALEIVSKRKHGFTPQETNVLRELIFGITNFYLGYQQQNDKALQIAYSTVATKALTADIKPYLTLPEKKQFGPKIRLGLASEYLRHHNGSYWAYGWLSNLPKDDYEFFLYSLNGHEDHVTRKFAELGTYRWLPFRSITYAQSLEAIRQDNLDVLLLTDVGMTVSSNVLALTRMAPVQCVAFGHPITTGSANMDFYLTSDLMETAGADSQYSEKLIRLPNIGFTFEYPPVPSELLSRADFGIPDGRVVYGSVQSLFKYLPQYDYLYAEIAKKVPNAFFVFVANESERYTDIFKERLIASFASRGLDYSQYVMILPRMPLPRFLQLLAVLDLNLDTVGWNGGTTTLRSLAMDCPVITIPGETMRSRHCYSILKMLGADELIANSSDDYIALAERIGVDRQYRAAIVDMIKGRKHVLFNDTQCVDFLDRFFKSEVERLRAGS